MSTTMTRPKPKPKRWNLLIAMNARGVNQKTVAASAKISDSWLSRIANGKIEPTPEMKKRIARVLHADEEDLFNERA